MVHDKGKSRADASEGTVLLTSTVWMLLGTDGAQMISKHMRDGARTVILVEGGSIPDDRHQKMP